MPRRSARARQSKAKAWVRLKEEVEKQEVEEVVDDVLENGIVEHDQEMKKSQTAPALPALDE